MRNTENDAIPEDHLGETSRKKPLTQTIRARAMTGLLATFITETSTEAAVKC